MVADNSIDWLLAWTLTHPTRVFSEIQPVFNTRNDLLDYVLSQTSKLSEDDSIKSYNRISSEIAKIALTKIGSEWRAWINAHAELSIDENRLDNILMTILYRFILERDQKMCVLCKTAANLTIHHIIPKQRNIRRYPPFGRSVPTNLITLCRHCHSSFHETTFL